VVLALLVVWGQGELREVSQAGAWGEVWVARWVLVWGAVLGQVLGGGWGMALLVGLVLAVAWEVGC
jgi:hypothetical protein